MRGSKSGVKGKTTSELLEGVLMGEFHRNADCGGQKRRKKCTRKGQLARKSDQRIAGRHTHRGSYGQGSSQGGAARGVFQIEEVGSTKRLQAGRCFKMEGFPAGKCRTSRGGAVSASPARSRRGRRAAAALSSSCIS